MPTVTVVRQALMDALGEQYTDKDFEDLFLICFGGARFSDFSWFWVPQASLSACLLASL